MTYEQFLQQQNLSLDIKELAYEVWRKHCKSHFDGKEFVYVWQDESYKVAYEKLMQQSDDIIKSAMDATRIPICEDL